MNTVRLFWTIYTATVVAATVWFWRAPSLGRVVEAFVTLLLTTGLILACCQLLDTVTPTRKRHPDGYSEWRTPNP